MIKNAKFYVEWICPYCQHKNKRRAYQTNSCTLCGFVIELVFCIPKNNAIIYNKKLLKHWLYGE